MEENKNREKYLHTAEDRELYAKIINHVNFSAKTEKKRRDRWEEIWRLWTQAKDSRIPRFRANSRLPIARTAVNTFAAFLSAKEPTFNVYPVGTEDFLKAQMAREVLQFQAKKTEILDLKRRAKIMIKSACLFDVGIVKITWKTRTIEKETEDGKKEVGIVYDYPCIENVHTLDFFPDPYIGRMQDQQLTVERMVVPLEELRADRSLNIPVDFKPTYSDAQSTSENSSGLNVVDLTTGQGDADTQNKVEVYEAHTKTHIYVLVDPNGSPFFAKKIKKPLDVVQYVKMDFEVEPVPNRFYGAGMISPNIDIHKAIDAVLNNIRDNVNILINPMYKVRRGARIDPRQLVSKPGGAIDVESMQDIDQLRTQDTTGSGFQMFSLLNSLYQSGTRVQSVRSGGSSEANTATEAEIQQQNADVVTNAVKDNFEQALSEIGTLVLKLNVANMQQNGTIRIFNPELIEYLSNTYLPDVLSEEQKLEAISTGQLGGYALDQKQIEEIKLHGRINPEPLSQDDIERIKTYGELIKYSKQFIDVDADVIVEADSTLKKDSAVLRQQVSNIVNMVARLPDGASRVDWDLFSKTMAELSSIPALKKLIKSPEPAMPMQPPQGEENRMIMPPGEQRVPAMDEMQTQQAFRQQIQNMNSPQ